MITADKLRIYEKFGGDIDGFVRASVISERESITDKDWHLIAEILQSLSIVRTGLASADFEAQVQQRTINVAPDEQVRTRLFQLSKPKTQAQFS
jgi:hypothetical protein